MDETIPLKFAITTVPTNVLQSKLYDNIFFDPVETDEYIPGPQHVVRIDLMLDEYAGEIPEENPVSWFGRNVMDHCPVYAVFDGDLDTD